MKNRDHFSFVLFIDRESIDRIPNICLTVLVADIIRVKVWITREYKNLKRTLVKKTNNSNYK